MDSIEPKRHPDSRQGTSVQPDAIAQSAAGLLALQSMPKIGPAKALRLAVFTANFDALIDEQAAAWSEALERAQAELESLELHEITALSLFDERYPNRLRVTHNPPLLLFVRGPVEVLSEERFAAVIGTREPTQFGRSATQEITSVLAEAGWTIGSGLAKGIDTIAHRSALEHRAKTVAVLAGGLDHVYPAENRELADAILDRGGALVSEQRWGERPRRSTFVTRNRIQSGLSAALILTQSGAVGGGMHTVRYAAEQGRPVFVPEPKGGGAKNEGLEILLRTPARELCECLPAWKRAHALARRLRDAPLAQAITPADLDRLPETLDRILAQDTQTGSDPRWWPEPDPPTRFAERDDAGEQSSLFALSD